MKNKAIHKHQVYVCRCNLNENVNEVTSCMAIMLPQSYRLPNKNSSVRHGMPSFKLLIGGIQETPKTIK